MTRPPSTTGFDGANIMSEVMRVDGVYDVMIRGEWPNTVEILAKYEDQGLNPDWLHEETTRKILDAMRGGPWPFVLTVSCKPEDWAAWTLEAW